MGFTGTHRVDSRRLRSALLLVGLFVAFWVILSVVISGTVFRTFDVVGNSMSPTLQHGERVAVLLLGSPGRRDIVVLDAPPQARFPRGSNYMKRVVAIGGDIVSCCSGGRLVVNGEVVNEPYAVPSQPRFARVRVPRGDVFVLGDNREDSEDSRSWGPIPTSLVIGRVVAYGTAAIALSPIAVGCLLALALAFASWVFWTRRTTQWRVKPGPPESREDQPGSTQHS